MILVRALYSRKCFECFIKEIKNQEFTLNERLILIENGLLKESESVRFDPHNQISLNKKIRAFDKIAFEPFNLIFLELKSDFLNFTFYAYQQKVSIGNKDHCDIQLDFDIDDFEIKIRSALEASSVLNVFNCKELFLNGSQFSEAQAELFSCISFERYRIFILNHAVCVAGPVKINRKSSKPMIHPIRQTEKKQLVPSRFLIEDLKEQNLMIEAPKRNLESEEEISFMEYSPLILISASVLMNFSNHRVNELSAWIYPSAMMISMIFIPMMQRRQKRKQKDQRKKEYEHLYLDYLNQMNQKIEEIKLQQKNYLEIAYPSAKKCFEILKENKERRLNRSALQAVHLRIGQGAITSSLKISYENVRHDQKRDSLCMAYENCCKSSLKILKAPILRLLKKEMNVVAEKKEQIIFLQNLILQLVVGYDPDSLLLILVCDFKEVQNFEFIQFCRHFWHADRFRFILCDAIQIQEGIYHLKKIRDRKKLVFILNDADFQAQDVSIIRFTDQRTKISKRAEQVLDLNHSQYWEGNKITSFQKELYKMKNLKEIKPVLSDLLLSDHKENEIPDESDLFSLNPVLKSASAVIKQWRDNQIEESLIIPLGIKEKGQTLYFDLHEKFHGPHGLIAGMTGSGKTQLLLEIILNYASYYPCDLLNILLFDFKGGDLSEALVNDRFALPHISGVLTNLNQKEIERIQKSLEHELIMRQNLMNEAKRILKTGSMNIYEYQRAYKAHKLKKPCSHLLFIVDEFAELKSQVPSFMDYLIKIARIGRSLGIHLILATQKPSGVVNDQIWSNSKFKICMKVQSSQDSLEMIKSNRAALIKSAGRFILAAGYEEELSEGQAPYLYFDEFVNEKSASLKILNLQGQIKTEKREKERKEGRIQFDMAVKNCCEANRIMKIKPKMCWYDPLPVLLLADPDIPLMTALMDDPEFQQRLPFCFSTCESLLIYGKETSDLMHTFLKQIAKWTKKQILLISGNDKTHQLLKNSGLFILDIQDKENLDANLRIAENSSEELAVIFEMCDELLKDLNFKERLSALKRKFDRLNSCLVVSVSSLKNCSFSMLKEFHLKMMLDSFDKSEVLQFFGMKSSIIPIPQKNRALIFSKGRILESQICLIDELLQIKNKSFWIDLHQDLSIESMVDEIRTPLIPIGRSADTGKICSIDCRMNQHILSQSKEKAEETAEIIKELIGKTEEIEIRESKNEDGFILFLKGAESVSEFVFVYQNFHKIKSLENGIWLGKDYLHQRTLINDRFSIKDIAERQAVLIKNGKAELFYPIRKRGERNG